MLVGSSAAKKFTFMILLKVTPLILILVYTAMFVTHGGLTTSPMHPPPTQDTTFAYTPDPHKLVDLQLGFEGIAESSIGMSSGISLAVDLSARVRSSDLGCKENLSLQLDSVVAQAERAGSKLQKLGETFSGAADRIGSMDESVLRSLEHFDKKLTSTSSTEQFSITKYLFSFWTAVKRLFFSFWPTFAPAVQEEKEKPTLLSDEAVADARALAKQLLSEANASASEVDRLRMMHHTLYETAMREKQKMLSKRTILVRLYELWLWLIGRSRAAVYESHRNLLDSIIQYHNDALNSIDPTVVQLRQLTINLDKLLERLAVQSSDPNLR